MTQTAQHAQVEAPAFEIVSAAPADTSAMVLFKGLRDGETIEELNEAIAEAVEITQATGLATTIQVKLTIGSKGRSIVVTDDIDVKKPKLRKKIDTVFFAKDGALTRHDPQQMNLDEVEPGFGRRH